MNTKFYCPDIECDSCIKIIKKTLEKENGVKYIKVSNDSFNVEYDGSLVDEKHIMKLIKEKGFRVGLNPFEKKNFKERYRDFRQNKFKYEIEYNMLKYSVLTLFYLIILELIVYYTFFRTKTGFFANYAWWIFYVDIAIISIGAAMWHIKSYVAKFTSMVGMMIGMTFGMQTGMMIGTIIGATNGFLYGSLLGMILAVAVGFYNGRISGIMGIMEGMMAGLMGGLMGAMIGIMMRVENIYLFMPFFMIINLIIMWGLSYMLFEEVIEDNPSLQRNKINFMVFFSYCFIAALLIILFIVYGPKTGLARIVL